MFPVHLFFFLDIIPYQIELMRAFCFRMGGLTTSSRQITSCLLLLALVIYNTLTSVFHMLIMKQSISQSSCFFSIFLVIPKESVFFGFCFSWFINLLSFLAGRGRYNQSGRSEFWHLRIRIGGVFWQNKTCLVHSNLGGGFKYALFSPLLEEDSHFDL